MAREKLWTRIHLTPVLQAEADRDDVRRALAADARERELMKDVKGWEFGSVYTADRYVCPRRASGCTGGGLMGVGSCVLLIPLRPMRRLRFPRRSTSRCWPTSGSKLEAAHRLGLGAGRSGAGVCILAIRTVHSGRRRLRRQIGKFDRYHHHGSIDCSTNRPLPKTTLIHDILAPEIKRSTDRIKTSTCKMKRKYGPKTLPSTACHLPACHLHDCTISPVASGAIIPCKHLKVALIFAPNLASTHALHLNFFGLRSCKRHVYAQADGG